MIQFEKVTKRYGEKTALNQLTLKIENGEIFGLIGHNGAGKSTTIKALVSVIEPEEGEIFVDGLRLRDHRLEVKKKIGYVSDNPDKFLMLTPMEFWNFLREIYGIPEEEFLTGVEKLTKTFQLEEIESPIKEFSHGMRQKVFVIGALLPDPDVWVLDEPLTGLDPAASFALKEMMREHAAKGKTVLFSTHVLEVAEKLCDRIGILRHGELIFLGTLEELKETRPESSLEEIYLNMVKAYEKE